MKFASVLTIAVTAFPARYQYEGASFVDRILTAIAIDPKADFIPVATPAVVPAVPFTINYVAANRGSVHVAPLNGHIQSVRTFNTDPAPETQLR